MRQSPIESQFIKSLADNLNAEICLGKLKTFLFKQKSQLKPSTLIKRERDNG